ncbi:MAG: hypothetical protein IJ826_04660 [Bacteroidaceae bacterium]|nr:hypothetical protein [Bacteroidaceae bacterium]
MVYQISLGLSFVGELDGSTVIGNGTYVYLYILVACLAVILEPDCKGAWRRVLLVISSIYTEGSKSMREPSTRGSPSGTCSHRGR